MFETPGALTSCSVGLPAHPRGWWTI